VVLAKKILGIGIHPLIIVSLPAGPHHAARSMKTPSFPSVGSVSLAMGGQKYQHHGDLHCLKASLQLSAQRVPVVTLFAKIKIKCVMPTTLPH
jgi:hypothetical protein